MKINNVIKSVFFIFGLVFLVGCGPEPEVTADGYARLSGEELQKIEENNKDKEKYVVIDVRSAKDYDAGHVKHAINIPLAELEQKINTLDKFKDQNVVVYCNTDRMSTDAAKILVKNNFTKVIVADGVKQFDYKKYTVASVMAEELIEMNNNPDYLVIDVRPAKDYVKGHLSNAINIPLEDIEARYNEIPRDKAIVTYCYSGNRSHEVAAFLKEKNYDKVYNALDGTKEYKFDLVQ